jgi:hypothetical protein
MAMRKAKKRRKPGPAARYGYRPTLTIRLTEPVYKAIKTAAGKHGKSLSEQIEDTLTRLGEIDALYEDARKALREANEIRSASKVQAYRDAGFRILREVEGRPTRVIVTTELLDAEAGVTEGFIEDPAKGKADDEAA